MTDILPYGFTHPAPQFPIAFKGVFNAGSGCSVKPLHKSSQCQQALRTARETAIKFLKLFLMARPQEAQSLSWPGGR